MLYDITPTITPQLKVWPGDTRARREVLLDMDQGANITLSTLHATVHLGAHADAPNHYGKGLESIETRPLDVYLGPCEVVHVQAEPGRRIEADQIGPTTTQRVLIGTGTYPDPECFNEDFAALSPDLVDALHERGVRLIGVDVPSVDLFTSKDLPAHHRFRDHDMSILEGLVLRDVPAGTYELIALPLPLAGFDASPVRAVLRTL
jgi:arylformamidase